MQGNIPEKREKMTGKNMSKKDVLGVMKTEKKIKKNAAYCPLLF